MEKEDNERKYTHKGGGGWVKQYERSKRGNMELAKATLCPEEHSGGLAVRLGLAMLQLMLPMSFRTVHEWFPGPAQVTTILPVHVILCSSISMASLIIWSMYLVLVENMAVS
jgi:hypothetical protein